MKLLKALHNLPSAASSTVLSYLSSSYRMLNSREDGHLPVLKRALACSEWEAVQLLSIVRTHHKYR
jgi:hypothetical protein